MSARAVITMSPEQYLAGLKQLEAATNKSANKMENSFKEYGTSINKAGIAMRYVSSEMGAGAVAFGRAFQVLAGGKIAIAVAAITGAFVALKKAMDKITLSDEEYNQILDDKIKIGDKELQQLRQQQSEEDGYLERLKELQGRENKTNEEQIESARLAEILVNRYGKLGISVSDLTGDFFDLSSAIEKIDKAQKEQRLDALANQIANVGSKTDSLIKNKLKGGIGAQLWDWATTELGENTKGQSNVDLYNSLTSEQKLAFAKNMLENGANTEGDIRFWAEQRDELQKIVDLEKQMDNLAKRNAETEKEIADELKKESEEARRIAKEREDADKAAADALDEEERQRAEIDRKHGEALAKELETEQKIAAEKKKAAEQRRTNDIASLRGAAYRALGMDEQADIESAIYAEIQANGGDIDSKTRKEITARVKARRALSAAMQTSTSPELYAPRVNSLIARGGSSAPVKMPEVEKLQNKQLDAQNKTNQIAQRILNQLDGWNTI